MPSLEIVDYINFIRKPGEAMVCHDNFMAKVPKIIGEIMAPEFLGTIKYASGTGGLHDQKVYNLPRTEAAMMAMSYSPDLMRAVMDAWDAAEVIATANLSKTAAKVPSAVVVNVPEPGPDNAAELVLTMHDGVQTMTLLDIVA